MLDDPFGISAESKSKLSLFRYDKSTLTDMSVSEAADGAGPAQEGVEPSSIAKVGGDAATSAEVENEATPVPDVKNAPQTPAHRIPLADLISNTEDALNRAPGKSFTPDDQVHWDHRNSVTKGKGVSPLGLREKRCRSSSPTSSPLNPDGKDAPVNSQSPRKVLKTPQHDIAADLWSKYIGKNNSKPEEGPPKIHFSQLTSSSPQTPAPPGRTGRNSTGLRRTNSCAVDWPTSNTKRRRLDNEKQANNRIRDSFARSKSSILESRKPKSSKIGMLVEKIQETLTRRSTQDLNGPSSSSPLPERSEHMGDCPATPPKDIDAGRSVETPSKSPAKANHPNLEQPGVGDENLDQNLSSSSEFGDADLDNDFLDLAVNSQNEHLPAAAAAAAAPPQAVGRDGVVTGFDIPGVDQSGTEAAVENTHKEREILPRHSEMIPHVNAEDEADEFDDGDDEFADGMEQILAQCEHPDGLSAGQVNTRGQIQSQGATALAPSDTIENLHQSKTMNLDNEDDYGDDGFDDGGIDLQAIEQTMEQALGSGTPSQRTKCSQAIKRHLILDLAENSYVNAKGRTQLEKVLFVQEEKNTQHNLAVTLRESWFDSPCEKGSYIHLVGDFDSKGQCTVDDKNNLIVLHPDHLLSATMVADSFTCSRRAVLQDRVKATSDASKPQVYGHILHYIFQEAMKVNRWDLPSLNASIDDVLPKYVESLYDVNVTMDEAAEHLKSKMPALKAWAESFLLVSPSADSLMEDRNGSKARMCINKLLEVEEHIWSPMYGLKGNIDATVQVDVRDGKGDIKNLTVPLEVKTGRNDKSETHRAQTALYCLLLSDRYDIDVTFGILYYLEVSKTLRIRAVQTEIRQMVQQRNRLAGYVRHRLDLPPMLKNPRICNQCYAKTTCFAYHKLVDDGDGDTSGMGKTFADTVGHLNAAHQTFFKKWDALLNLEEKHLMKFRRELWTMLSHEREDVGRCFSSVVVEPGSGSEDTDGPKINRFQYTFVKRDPSPGFSFSDSQITVGEPIVISDEKGHFALSNGYVVNISPKRITVAVDRRLHNARTQGADFDADLNQNFTGIMEIVEDNAGRAATVKPGKAEDTTVYRLDKDEFSNGMATVRNNILCLMEQNLFRAKRLRELIVDGAPPSFKPSSAMPNLSPSAQAGLNVDQKSAIDKVMSADDYALVLGMPGTGKTTTIAQIIRAIVAQGKSVLLTSYTHTAVDNILLKIRDDNIRTLRIGAPAKIHPDVQKFADIAAIPKTTIAELQDSYENSRIVATTCLGVNHTIFNHRTFDYCIVDEASQITLPVCLGPIRMAKTFVLVGDHYQLPPLVQNKEASDGGLDISLFKLLCDTQPSSVVDLEHQYRMCEDIMLLSNSLIYSGRLKCGTPEVAARSLNIRDIHHLKQHHFNSLAAISSSGVTPCLEPALGRCWLRNLLDPSAKVRLVNTDQLEPQAIESSKGSRITNPIEATICTQLVEALISVGVSAREIGVVTLYRSQLALLRQKLRHRLPDLELHTADRFQGRDKEVIVMSCVRSNPECNVGDLLRDRRRVNVAFTRARTKMLVVGSKATLSQGNELLGRFVKLMDDKGWCYDLPRNAVETHVFEEADQSSSMYTQKSPGKQKDKTSSSSPEKKNGGSPSKQTARSPLSPVKNTAVRKPEKVGAKMDAKKIVGKRPVLGDVLNDMLG